MRVHIYQSAEIDLYPKKITGYKDWKEKKQKISVGETQQVVMFFICGVVLCVAAVWRSLGKKVIRLLGTRLRQGKGN